MSFRRSPALLKIFHHRVEGADEVFLNGDLLLKVGGKLIETPAAERVKAAELCRSARGTILLEICFDGLADFSGRQRGERIAFAHRDELQNSGNESLDNWLS